MPAAEAVAPAAGICFTPFEAPVVGLRAIKPAMDDGFVKPEIVLAHDAIALIRLRVGGAGETQSGTHYNRN